MSNCSDNYLAKGLWNLVKGRRTEECIGRRASEDLHSVFFSRYIHLYSPNPGLKAGSGEPTRMGRIASLRVGHSKVRARQLTSQARLEGRRRRIGDADTSLETKLGGYRLLVSEFRIKQQLAALEILPDRPFGKAKKILRLARFVAHGARRMSMLADWYLSLGDIGRAARFERAKNRLIRLHDDIRAKARRVLECGNERLGFGYSQQPADRFVLPEST